MMKHCPTLIFALIFFYLASLTFATKENEEIDLELLKLLQKYPEHIVKQLKDTVDYKKRSFYDQYILEMRTKTGYNVLVTSSFGEWYKGDKLRGRTPHTISYRCKPPTRYCSGNPNNCHYVEGDRESRIIISAPHGGSYKPDVMSDRLPGCYIHKECIFTHDCVNKSTERDAIRCPVRHFKDSYTKEISLEVGENLKKMTKIKPHLVINDLYRGKLDPNRDINDATLGDRETQLAWMDYNKFLALAKEKLVHERGILFDMHGQAHAAGLLEIGYLVTKAKLNAKIYNPQNTTIKALAAYVKRENNVSFKDLLIGRNSFGYFMEKENVGTIPSPEYPQPGERKYYKGAYIITKYGSKDGGKIDAVQVESPAPLRNKEKLKKYSKALANAMVGFTKLNYECGGKC